MWGERDYYVNWKEWEKERKEYTYIRIERPKGRPGRGEMGEEIRGGGGGGVGGGRRKTERRRWRSKSESKIRDDNTMISRTITEDETDEPERETNPMCSLALG